MSKYNFPRSASFFARQFNNKVGALKVTQFIAVFAISCALFSTGSFADYESGRKAYNQGDYDTALREFRSAAARGDAVAAYALNAAYQDGRGVPQDSRQALVWLRKSAQLGWPHAQYELGLRYLYGEGVAKDEKKGLDWVRKSAAQGYANAQDTLRDASARNDSTKQTVSAWVRHGWKIDPSSNGAAVGFIKRKKAIICAFDNSDGKNLYREMMDKIILACSCKSASSIPNRGPIIAPALAVYDCIENPSKPTD